MPGISRTGSSMVEVRCIEVVNNLKGGGADGSDQACYMCAGGRRDRPLGYTKRHRSGLGRGDQRFENGISFLK